VTGIAPPSRASYVGAMTQLSRLTRSGLLAAAVMVVAAPASAQTSVTTPAPAADAGRAPGSFDSAVARAASLAPLQTLLVAVDGEILVDEGFHGHSTTAPTNIKSASKSIISALVGIAIERGILDGTDQAIAPILKDKLPANPDPRLSEITVGNLLSMQAGLERTSGSNYGGWVASRDWVANALGRPFVADPGGPMLYSPGSSHLLSAILTRESGRSTLALANDWLGDAGVRITSWERDPQGIYLGGNQMAMSARSLLAFGELYRNGGKTAQGRQVVPADWVAASWQPRTNSRFSGDAYGYGWFERNLAGENVHFAWGYGGQMLYIVPSLKLTVVMTSQESGPSARNGYRDALHDVLAEIIGAVRAA